MKNLFFLFILFVPFFAYAQPTPGTHPITPQMFGAVGDGVALDDQAIRDCINYAIANGNEVYIPKGNYKITEGVIAFDNGQTDKAFPNIYTAGVGFVKFIAAGINDAPLISITNGTAVSGVGRFWQGGSIGGITFTDTKVAGRSNVHALELRGIKGMKFGHLRGDNLNGSLVYHPFKVFSTTNPDPYSVWACQFDVLEANGCKGWGVENRNYLGFNANIVNCLRVVNGIAGGWFGFGTENIVNVVSMGSCSGWAFDDGTNIDAIGGAPLRFTVNNAELDNVEYGFRVNRARQTTFVNIRFVHRYNFGAINPAGGYWPRMAVSLASGASANTSEVVMNIIHRIEAGGTKPDMGKFIDGSNSSGITNIDIDNRIQDNATFGFNDNDLFVNMNPNTRIAIRREGKLVYDSRGKVAALATATAAQTVPNSGFITAAAKIQFPNERYDRNSGYNNTTSEYTIPYSGLYRVNASLNLSLPPKTRLRLGVMRDRGSVLTIVAANILYAVPDTINQVYEINRLIDFVEGDKVYIVAEQNTGAVVSLGSVFNTAGENQFSIQVID